MTDWDNLDDWLDQNLNPEDFDSPEEYREALKEHFEGEALEHAEEYAKEVWERETVLEISKDETEIARITPEEGDEAEPLEVSRGVIYRVQETASYAVKAVKKFIRFVRFW